MCNIEIDKIKQELIIHLEKYISQIDYMTNEEKEEMYLRGLGLTKEDVTVIWEDNEIVGFRPNKSCEYVSFTINIDKNSTELEL